MKKKAIDLINLLFSKDKLSEYELVDTEFLKEGGSWILRVIIDKPEGIQIKDCEFISKEISQILDEKDPIDISYNLEVSSPGIERPLNKIVDFTNNTGKEVCIYTYLPINGNKKIIGNIKGVIDDNVIIESGNHEVNIPFKKISKAHLVYRFK